MWSEFSVAVVRHYLGNLFSYLTSESLE